MLDDLPIMYDLVGFELTLALVRHKKRESLHPWFVLGLPTETAAKEQAGWLPVKDAETARHQGWHVWLWRKHVDLPGLEAFLADLRQGYLKTERHCFELELQERSAVLLPAGHSLAPRQDESAWVHEFWNQSHEVTTLGDAAWRAFVNGEVRKRLGINLEMYSDRVGNVTLFLPSGVKTRWRLDDLGRTLVFQTNLRPDALADLEVEVETWSGEELSDLRRQVLKHPSALFKAMAPFDKVRATLWHKGRLLHQTQSQSFIGAIAIEPSLVIGQRDGVTYTHSEGPTLIGDRSEAPWLRRQRDRRVETRKTDLARNLQVKFYDPNAQPSPDEARHEALKDLHNLVNRASTNLRLWDPYFGRAADGLDVSDRFEDLTLIEQLKRLNVDVQLLTSADDWTESGGSVLLDALKRHLEHRRTSFPARFGNVRCKAWVRRKDTAFHDRFVIVDRRDVFLLGSSTGGLGKKHSTLLKVEQAEAVISAFDHVWDGQDLSWGKLIEVYSGS